MDIDLIVLLFIIIFFFFLGRLSKDIKFNTKRNQTLKIPPKVQAVPSEPINQSNLEQGQREVAENTLEDRADSTQPALKVEDRGKAQGPAIMDYIMTSVMATVLIWIVNTGLEIFNLQTPYIQYLFYFVTEIFAVYPIANKSPNDLSVGLKAGLGATILTVLLYPKSWDFLNMLLLASVMISAGFTTSFLVKNKILGKRK